MVDRWHRLSETKVLSIPPFRAADKKGGTLMPQLAIHPGEHLAEELRELNMSAAALARQLKVPTNRITQILNGNRDITADTALRLAHFFGTTAEFWVNLQSIYDLRIAQRAYGKTIQELPTLKQMTAAHA